MDFTTQIATKLQLLEGRYTEMKHWNKEIAKEIGTRHRAGIGISKESDAIAIIVSEETGKISVAIDGNLIADVKEEALKNILIKYMINKRFAVERNRRVKKLKIKKENKQKQNEEH